MKMMKEEGRRKEEGKANLLLCLRGKMFRSKEKKFRGLLFLQLFSSFLVVSFSLARVFLLLSFPPFLFFLSSSSSSSPFVTMPTGNQVRTTIRAFLTKEEIEKYHSSSSLQLVEREELLKRERRFLLHPSILSSSALLLR